MNTIERLTKKGLTIRKFDPITNTIILYTPEGVKTFKK